MDLALELVGNIDEVGEETMLDGKVYKSQSLLT